MADFELGALADTIYRPRLMVRNETRYLCVRGWCADRKGDQVAAVKAQKKMLRPPFVAAAALELAHALRALFGPLTTASVTSVPCGHSRRPDCAGAQIAAAVALNLGAGHRPRFRNRFCRGVSHPKENARLPPIEIVDASPSPLVVVVDDIATTGWHLEEALAALRRNGLLAFGAAWISRELAASPSSEADDDPPLLTALPW